MVVVVCGRGGLRASRSMLKSSSVCTQEPACPQNRHAMGRASVDCLPEKLLRLAEKMWTLVNRVPSFSGSVVPLVRLGRVPLHGSKVPAAVIARPSPRAAGWWRS